MCQAGRVATHRCWLPCPCPSGGPRTRTAGQPACSAERRGAQRPRRHPAPRRCLRSQQLSCPSLLHVSTCRTALPPLHRRGKHPAHSWAHLDMSSRLDTPLCAAVFYSIFLTQSLAHVTSTSDPRQRDTETEAARHARRGVASRCGLGHWAPVGGRVRDGECHAQALLAPARRMSCPRRARGKASLLAKLCARH